ncbi:RluA family pseudouridine synthase [Candidatus Oleimmundimicrobium sp.]|uniref:RluA family pseudouridine synthase n=1 Tax=Candidatus Oleimmundimicrobium sp. TaxID=3060597 RepID=UPI00271E5592|nr:RluA family pseudouridine synthase [Candidatus Oleimmundimicrobium sp.]MDO8886479.1 RluA family pseudouridine synthase [Candidatus Oleimmundimicrobium sp.]
MCFKVAETKRLNLKVGDEGKGQRLDSFLVNLKEIPSRSFAQHLIQKGFVRVDDKRVSKNHRLKKGEVIFLEIPPPELSSLTPEEILLNIIYEDNDIIVLSKPAGIVVHPAYGHPSGTIVNALLAHTKDLSGIGGNVRPGIIHRLDKDTSGLMIVAKNDEAHRILSSELKDRKIKRFYLALVHGVVEVDSGTIDAPIGRSLKNRKKMAVTEIAARNAITTFKVKQRFSQYTLLEAKLETGRTHQIRVHMKYINHSVVGDFTYGYRKNERNLGLNRQFLHAYKLEFIHPKTGKKIFLEDNLPEELETVLRHLQEHKA